MLESSMKKKGEKMRGGEVQPGEIRDKHGGMVVIGTTADSGTLHAGDTAGKSRPLEITISTPPQRFPQCHRASTQLKGGVKKGKRRGGAAIGRIARDRRREKTCIGPPIE